MSDTVPSCPYGRPIRLCDVTLHARYADLLRPLTVAERQALRESIQAEGFRRPVLVTRELDVLDGVARLDLAAEMGMAFNEIPVLYVEDLGLGLGLGDDALEDPVDGPEAGGLLEIVAVPHPISEKVAQAIVLEANRPERRRAGAGTAATQAARRLLRVARLRRVAAAHLSGDSLRDIAEREQISPTQTQRDIDDLRKRGLLPDQASEPSGPTAEAG